jgi:biofilm PGA synthesis protein PgaA
MTIRDYARTNLLRCRELRRAARKWAAPWSALVLLLAVGAARGATETVSAPQAVREAAVARARAGDAKGALVILQALVPKFPEDQRLLADTTIVANWAGDDEYAVELYDRRQTPKDDAGVVEAAARSARNLHRYDLALDLFRKAETVSPQRWQPRLGFAMVLTDQGHYPEANALMQPLMADHGSEWDVETGQAYLCMRQLDFACVMKMYEQQLQQEPGDGPALKCQLAGALSEAGGNTLGDQLCEQANSKQHLLLEAAAGAERVRWVDSSDDKWAERKAEGEKALALLDDVIARSHTGETVWTQAESDRLLVLSDLHRMQDVLQSWEQLRRMKVTVPDYALGRVAEAYLALHHPEQAEALYRVLVERSPNDGDLRGSLAYAEFEREHIAQSFQTIDSSYKDAPTAVRSAGLKVLQSNSLHTSLGIEAAEMRGYAGMPNEEQRQLTPLLAQAPGNPEVARAMATTYLARGWPLLAIREERIADSFEQSDDLPILQDAEILEGAGRRDAAGALLGPLVLREGNSMAVEHFLRDRGIEYGWQTDVSSGYEWSNGQYLGNSSQSEAHLYSPLIDSRWRIYGHALGETGEFREGNDYRARTGLGLSYNYDRQSAWLELDGDSGTSGALAAVSAGGDLNVGDHWTVRAQGDTDDVTGVQLIAELEGIHARSGSATVEWRQSELRSITAGVQRQLYSDGNQRMAISGAWDQRVWTSSRLQMGIAPQVWTSANSENENRIYFNPKRDFSMGPKASVSWTSWRRYERSLRHEVTFYSAPYWQENYGLGAAFSTSYEQHWEVSRRLGFFGNVVWNSQPYDGSHEPYTDMKFGLTWGAQ